MKIILQTPSHKISPSLEFGYFTSPFGQILIVFNDCQEVYSIWFVRDKEAATIKQLEYSFPKTLLNKNQSTAQKLGAKIFSSSEVSSVSLVFYGTDFQQKVWKTLMQIPCGKTITYSQLAVLAGYPKAIRAVASAVARNRIAYLVPCHRIIPKNGNGVGHYRWGSDIKEKILIQEKKKCENIDLTA